MNKVLKQILFFVKKLIKSQPSHVSLDHDENI